ncbi:MAG: peptidylprolyl isomerase [Parvularculaceae bacterium]|nr:peptidylprolyl isomerase [Parvularculaceae bacterium]
MRTFFLTATLLAATPALADALEGKKSSAEILGSTSVEDWREIPADDLLVIELDRGKVYVALSPALAPAHVKQVKKLAREGFYDGLSFYRVIEGFVAQGGDPFGERKTKTSKKMLKAEFEQTLAKGFEFASMEDDDGYAPAVGFVAGLPTGHDAGAGAYWHLHCAGAFAFGREDGRDTASTEFYIALQPQRYLDRNMSVFGRVIAGMEHLQALRRVDPPDDKTDDLGETIKSIRVAADQAPEARETFEILDSSRPVFADFVEARRNRPESFFHFRPDFVDVCQLPVPVRKKSAS